MMRVVIKIILPSVEVHFGVLILHTCLSKIAVHNSLAAHLCGRHNHSLVMTQLLLASEDTSSE